MNFYRLTLTAFAISFSILQSNVAFARWDQIRSTDFTVPAPPDAQASSDEIEILLQFQNERSKQQCDLGLKQAHPGFRDFFDDVPYLPPHQFELLAPFMEKVSRLGERITDYYKSRYRRIRPYRFDSRIVPCGPAPSGSKSYPSSHATVATLDTCILAKVFPRWSAQYADLGVEISERRLQIGVHFPSDVSAGQNLANAICQRLLQEPDFKRELNAVRQSL